MGRCVYRVLWGCALLVLFFLLGCQAPAGSQEAFKQLSKDAYADKVLGAWQATMLANHTGLRYEGLYIDEPSPDETIKLALLDEWSTDDDTAIEWVDLHILETYGLDPSYEQIRTEWVAHLNNDIWNSTLRARQLMDEGVLPPDTGSAALNPVGAWSISAQLETEVFGLIAPGMPTQAAQRAAYFARVTNSGPAVEASAFYASMYALAYFDDDVVRLIEGGAAELPENVEINQIAKQVRRWHRLHPDDWRMTRELIRGAYDHDPDWWASRVNFASTIMALLYGEGDFMRTLTIACLAGWDADNNATTSAGLLGIMLGYDRLPEPVRGATQVYFNQDVTGGLPEYTSVPEIAAQTQSIAEDLIVQVGGQVMSSEYLIPVGH
jgi:ADP-ribosylglycohydrolase